MNNIYKQLFENYFNGAETDNDEIIKDIESQQNEIDLNSYQYGLYISLDYVVSKTLGDVHAIEKIPFYGMLHRFKTIVDNFHFIDDYSLCFMLESPSASIIMCKDYNIPVLDVYSYLNSNDINDREKINNYIKTAIDNYIKYADDNSNKMMVSITVSFNKSEKCSFIHLTDDMKRLREFILTMNRYGRLTGFAPKAPECQFSDKLQDDGQLHFSNLIWKFLLNSDVERIGNFIYPKTYSILSGRNNEIHTMFPRAVYNFINKMFETFGSENIDITGLRAESIGNKTFEIVFHLINVKREGYTMQSVIEAIWFNIDNLSKTDKLALLDCYESLNIWMQCDDIPKERKKIACETAITDDFIPYTIKFIDDSSEARKYRYASKTNPQKDEYSIHSKTIKNLENLYLTHKADVERYIRK